MKFHCTNPRFTFCFFILVFRTLNVYTLNLSQRLVWLNYSLYSIFLLKLQRNSLLEVIKNTFLSIYFWYRCSKKQFSIKNIGFIQLVKTNCVLITWRIVFKIHIPLLLFLNVFNFLKWIYSTKKYFQYLLCPWHHAKHRDIKVRVREQSPCGGVRLHGSDLREA